MRGCLRSLSHNPELVFAGRFRGPCPAQSADRQRVVFAAEDARGRVEGEGHDVAFTAARLNLSAPHLRAFRRPDYSLVTLVALVAHLYEEPHLRSPLLDGESPRRAASPDGSGTQEYGRDDRRIRRGAGRGHQGIDWNLDSGRGPRLRYFMLAFARRGGLALPRLFELPAY